MAHGFASLSLQVGNQVPESTNIGVIVNGLLQQIGVSLWKLREVKLKAPTISQLRQWHNSQILLTVDEHQAKL
jgi:hypothetical protein